MTEETILANANSGAAGRGAARGAASRRTGASPISDDGAACRGAVDCGGDYLAPGLVELHTDNLERHIQPRPGVDWPHDAAILAHDAELASVGITTVFDAMRVGSVPRRGALWEICPRAGGASFGAARSEALRISHFLHLRAEVCSETLVGRDGGVRPRGPGGHRQPDGPHAGTAAVSRPVQAGDLHEGQARARRCRALPRMSRSSRRCARPMATVTSGRRWPMRPLWRGAGQP